VRDRLVTLTTIVFSLVYVIIAAREHVASGGPAIGRTIASRSSTSPKSAEETLLLYQHATQTLPRGASITVFKPANRADDKQMLRIAHGQLPYHRVVPQAALETPHAPDFVITLGGPLADPRYELMHASPVGAIWRRTRW
jgi:hypothetical protein